MSNPCPIVVVPADCQPQAIAVPKKEPIQVITKILRGETGAQGDKGEKGETGAPGGTVDGNVREELAIANEGDTMFPLLQTVVSPELSRVFLNGQKLIYGQGYTFSGSMTILVFISTLYDLEPDDTLEIYYSV